MVRHFLFSLAQNQNNSMKKVLPLLIGGLLMLCISISSQAQKVKNKPQFTRCGSLENIEYLRSQNPNLDNEMKDAKKQLAEYLAKYPKGSNRSALLPPDTIPVVVHVVWNTAAENISDAQIESQIDILNADFARENADTVNTPGPFKPLGGSIPFRFHLARRDPNGNSTTGIVRVNTAKTSFSTNNNVKYNAQGGDNSWNTNLYLNIWVCDLGSFLLGYGEFPTGTITPTRGLVCHYLYFGLSGAANAPYNLGRTSTHEIGHCFDLKHIWGDDGTACTGSDNISDTPNQAGENYTTPAYPLTDACSPAAPGVMFMNYMDYTDDGGMNMFTVEQGSTMAAVINNFYSGTINSVGLNAVATASVDASATAITNPKGSLCSPTVTPSLTLLNPGLSTLTSVTINYFIDNNTPQQYNWTGSLVTTGSTVVTLPSITLPLGSHTFTCFTSLPNGVADPNALNDSTTVSFATSSALPYSQSFNTLPFPPANYQVVNPDGLDAWDRSATVNHSGAGSMVFDNYTNDNTGEIDDFITPIFDLTSVTNPSLSFYLAYKLYTDPSLATNFSDTLEVLVSADCGLTYTSVYKKFGIPLTTTTPTWANSAYTTVAANQWRKEVVNLGSFATSTSAVFKFRNISQYENYLYIDDINLTSTTALNNLSASEINLSVYPNPNNGKFHLSANNLPTGDRSVVISNLLGEVVYNQALKSSGNLNEEIDLTSLNSGVYLMKLITGENQIISKLTINH